MRIDMPKNMKKIHETTISIRWGDMDPYRHINNTAYFRYMEQARIEWMTSLGFSSIAEKEAMIMVNGFCNFYKQAGFRDPCTSIHLLVPSAIPLWIY
jgi:acyl-CoA thioester hydrolase